MVSKFLIVWYVAYSTFDLMSISIIGYVQGGEGSIIIAFEELPNTIFNMLNYSYLIFIPVFILMYLHKYKIIKEVMGKKAKDLTSYEAFACKLIGLKSLLFMMICYGVEAGIASFNPSKEINYSFIWLFLLYFNPVMIKMSYLSIVSHFKNYGINDYGFTEDNCEYVEKKVFGIKCRELVFKKEFEHLDKRPKTKELINLGCIMLIGLALNFLSAAGGFVSAIYTDRLYINSGTSFVSSKSDIIYDSFVYSFKGENMDDISWEPDYKDEGKNGRLLAFLSYRIKDISNKDEHLVLYNYLEIALLKNRELFSKKSWASMQPSPNTYFKLKDLYTLGNNNGEKTLMRYKEAIDGDYVDRFLDGLEEMKGEKGNFIVVLIAGATQIFNEEKKED